MTVAGNIAVERVGSGLSAPAVTEQWDRLRELSQTSQYDQVAWEGRRGGT